MKLYIHRSERHNYTLWLGEPFTDNDGDPHSSGGASQLCDIPDALIAASCIFPSIKTSDSIQIDGIAFPINDEISLASNRD